MSHADRSLGGAVRGARDVGWAAAHLARNPRLWPLTLGPLVAAAIPLGLLWTAFGLLRAMLLWFAGLIPGVASRVGDADAWVSAMLASASYVWVVAVVAVLATPFGEMLSERVECELRGEPEPSFSFLVFVRDLFLGIAHAVRYALAYLLTLAVLFVIGLVVPVIGPAIYAVGAVWVTVRFTAYDAADTIFARKGTGFRAKFDYLAAHRMRAYAIGGLMALGLAVPVAGVLAFPIGAVAATRMWLDVGGAPASG